MLFQRPHVSSVCVIRRLSGVAVAVLAVAGSFLHVSTASAAAWNVVSSPNPGATGDQLYSVSVIPGTSKLWAVGRFENNPSPWAALTQLYDGSSWTTVANDTSATGGKASTAYRRHQRRMHGRLAGKAGLSSSTGMA
jgi:hypothetical protein